MRPLYLPFCLSIILFVTQSHRHFQDKPLGEKIIYYVDKVLGEKVDRGECWDLVAYALDSAHANWTRPEEFGKEINPSKVPLMAGDIISFKDAKFTIPGKGSATFTQHYAIVYQVTDANHFRIAHQNFANQRVVTLYDLDINSMTKGTLRFYRPR
jgi:hypothetical protein